jgi:hypothetical protein
VVTIELRDLAHDIINALLAGFPAPALRKAIEQVLRADALIAVTALYSGSSSGLFKSFFDVLDPGALAGKTVLVAATRHGIPSRWSTRSARCSVTCARSRSPPRSSRPPGTGARWAAPARRSPPGSTGPQPSWPPWSAGGSRLTRPTGTRT